MLVLIVVALCAPVRYAGHSDGERFSTDEDALWASGAALDDGGADFSPVMVADSFCAERAPTNPVVADRASSSDASVGAARGLRAAPGVIGFLFRPPRV